MRYIIIGAGAVGGSIGGRLHEAGQDVVLVARGAHHRALREHGLRLTTPAGTLQLDVPVVDRPEDVGLRDGDVLVLAVKTQDSVAALDTWAARPVAGGGTAGERLPVVCAQNGVENERLALRRFRQVYGMCVVLPSTFLTPGAIAAPCGPYTGALVLGRYPAGADDTARRIAAGLEKSAFLAPVVPDVMRWKYGKLLGNLANAVEAVCGHDTGAEARDLTARAKAEGAAVLAAAGIAATGGAELADLRRDAVEVQPLGDGERALGSSWQSLVRGAGSIETDHLNGEIVLLGREHAVPTPVNELLQRAANDSARGHREPGALTAAALAALLDGPRAGS
ncbi:2-dehydropantoate 2-reductase N-terminal domain-containing protein [Streptomyces sp. SL13]|uniref:2-dehydropantoate 2-reductase N-terminal domain-containing protein n=1 Tax=Streptantibioticus silvisoli TaxID=2705255 RepID=A0AA90H460_9ACTN|nr:2-dehydropantoate 2-reductase N-terminal domain-containing protein [Streptantibioticus silvisoli]MDI5973788.1 2-dehydropantoate 2-reductase N-terminal domain-containing protein [Streptantibioticus silvisoli]